MDTFETQSSNKEDSFKFHGHVLPETSTAMLRDF